MSNLTTNVWKSAATEVARKIELDDLPGYLSKELIIEHGTKAAFFENGQFAGEAGPGRYTLKTLFDTLKFWHQKVVTVLLTRQDELELQFPCAAVETRDPLFVEATLRLTTRIGDLGLFAGNLMAGRVSLTSEELRELVAPLAQQALAEAVGRQSLKDLTGADAGANLDAGIHQALYASLCRYGLEFGRVTTVSIAHPQYDAQRQRQGELWLAREGVAVDQLATQDEIDRLLASIKRREELDELDILSREVATDHATAKLAVLKKRIALRTQYRNSLQADQFDKVQSEEELRKFLQARDHERLISQGETDALVATVLQQGEDREAQRRHLLSKIEIEQQFDIEEYRAEFAHAAKVKSLEQQADLAQRSQTEDSRRWTAGLEQQVQADAARRQREIEELEHLRQTTRAAGTTRRDDEWEEALQQQRVARVRGETKSADAEREHRLALFAIELESSRAAAKFQQDKNAADWNLERWKEIQRIKQGREDAETQREERTRQAEHERTLDQRRLDLERLQAHGSLGTEQLIAVAGVENASRLADVAKTRVVQEAAIAAAQSNAAAQTAVNRQIDSLQQQLHAALAAKDSGTVAALQHALTAVQANFHHLTAMADNLSKNLAPQAGQTVVVANGQATPVTAPGAAHSSAEPPRVQVCAGCRAEIRATDRFCPNCGKGV